MEFVLTYGSGGLQSKTEWDPLVWLLVMAFYVGNTLCVKHKQDNKLCGTRPG